MSRRGRHRPSFEGLEARRLLATITWDGGGDGTSFGEASNWVGGVVPGNLDTAVIDDGNPTITISGSVENVHELDQTGGTLVFTSGLLGTTPGLCLLNGCIVDDNGGSEVGGMTITDSTVNNGPNASSGFFHCSGTCTVNGQIRANESFAITGTSSTPGTLILAGGSSNMGQIDIENYGTVDVTGGSTYTNLGLLDCDSSENGFLQGSLSNEGTIQFEGSGNNTDLRLGMGASLINQQGGIINANGTLDDSIGSFVNDGTLSMATVNSNNPDVYPNTFNIDGNFTQSATGTLVVGLAGANTFATTEYSQLTVTGQANLAGTLDVEYTTGYMPAVGTAFEIISCGSESGSFATDDGISLGGGLQLNPTITDAGVTLIVGPPPMADLSVAVATTTPQITYGGTASYTVTLTNLGPDDAQGVVLTDTAPKDSTVDSVVSSVGSATTLGAVITLDLASLADAASVTLTIIVTPGLTGSAIDQASVVDASPTDPNLGNNSGSATSAVVPPPSADLAVAVVGPAAATSTGLVSFTTSVTNDGPNAATSTVLTDTIALPAGAVLVGETLGQGTVQVAGNVITATIGTLAASQTVDLTITLGTIVAGTFGDSASVTSATTDPNLKNNAASASGTVKGLPVLGLSTSSASLMPKKSLTLTAQVSVPPGFAAIVGPLSFYDGTTLLGTATPNAAGHASITTSLSTLGTHSLTVSYGGNAQLAASASSVLHVHVGDAVAGDYDGDGKTDVAIYDQTAAEFYILDSSGGSQALPFGNSHDVNIPVAGDYDGDGKDDIAIYDQTAAEFFLLYSGGGSLALPFGNPHDVNIPVAGDFDGKGKTDIAIYDQTASEFFILYSNGTGLAMPFGNAKHVNIPVTGDFDGDGKTDIAIYDQTAATFYVLESGGGSIVKALGNAKDVNIPIAADFDGDGKTDLAVYDQTAGVVLALESGGGTIDTAFGAASDGNLPVAGDFDGDGKTDLAIYDPVAGELFVEESGGGSVALAFGNAKHKNLPI